MRKVQLLLASTIVGIIAVACGSTTSNSPPGGGGDAGNGGDSAGNGLADGSDGASSSEDAGAEDAAMCVLGDADISTLSPPDASLNDAGGSVGACIGCAKAKCSTDVIACNTDCSCNTALVCIFDCIGGVGNTLISCASQCGGTTNLDTTEKTLLLCAYTQCKVECGQGTTATGGKDSGTDAEADAASEDGSAGDASDGG